VTRVLYDTSVVIEMTGLEEWVDSVPVISAVTLAELSSGLEVGDALERAVRRRRVNYAAATFQVLPFGAAEADAYGMLVSLIRESGCSHRGRAFDLQIAATAVTHRIPLLTRNPRDFDGLERALQIVPI
jgi:predicted nucleic acid-binding protein